jgi:hypothetical protein
LRSGGLDHPEDYLVRTNPETPVQEWLSRYLVPEAGESSSSTRARVR